MAKSRKWDGLLAMPILGLDTRARLVHALMGRNQEQSREYFAQEVLARAAALCGHFRIDQADPHWILQLIVVLGCEANIPAFKPPKKKGRPPTRKQMAAMQARAELLRVVEKWIFDSKFSTAGPVWAAIKVRGAAARRRLPDQYRETPMQTIRAEYSLARNERKAAERYRSTPAENFGFSTFNEPQRMARAVLGGLLSTGMEDKN